MRAAGLDPALLGPDEDLLASLDAYVELHIEQGRALADLDAPVGVAEGDLAARPLAARVHRPGRPRRDDAAGRPARPDAAVRDDRAGRAGRGGRARRAGHLRQGACAEPGGANGISSAVRAWLDARAPDEATLGALVDRRRARRRGPRRSGTASASSVRRESFTPLVVVRPRACATGSSATLLGGGHAGAADRGRPRRGHPGRPAAHRHAVRAQPDRRLALARPSTPTRPTARRAWPRWRPCWPTWPPTRPTGRPGWPPPATARAAARRPRSPRGRPRPASCRRSTRRRSR